MHNTELAYAAGILDGEGSINLVHSKPRNRSTHGEVYAQVGLTNTDERLIRWFHLEFGGTISHQKPGMNPLSKRDIWRWNLTHRKASEFLKLVLPYLWLKKPQAELAIQLQARKRVGQQKLTDEQLAVQEAEKLVMGNLNKGVIP